MFSKKKAFNSSIILSPFFINVLKSGTAGLTNTKVISLSFLGIFPTLMKTTTKRTSNSLSKEQNSLIKVSSLLSRLCQKWDEQSKSTSSTKDLKSLLRWVKVLDLISRLHFIWVGRLKEQLVLIAKLMLVTCHHNSNMLTSFKVYVNTTINKFW